MNTEVLIITGIIAGVAALNLVLLFSWFILKSRRRNSSTRKFTAGAGVSEKFTRRMPVASITLPRPPLPASLSPTPLKRHMTENPTTYRQLVMSAENTRRNQSVRLSNMVSSRDPRASRAQSRTKRPHRTAISSNIIQNDMLHISERPLNRGPSLRSAISADSASIYSAASAPLDFHDRLFQSMTLETVPASPGVVVNPSDTKTKTRYNMHSDSIAISERKSTTSEVHPQTPLTELPVNRAGDPAVSEIDPPSSPVTPISGSATAAFSVRKNTHLSSTKRIRVLTSVPPLVVPSSPWADPPRIPPRSPLRP